jgi:hypothetical protein
MDPIIQRARRRLEAAEEFDEGTYDRLVALRDQGLIPDINSLGLLKATYLGLIDPSGKELRGKRRCQATAFSGSDLT